MAAVKAVVKKGTGRPKKIGGVWHVWRKGYTVKSGANKGKRVAGRYVKAPKGFSAGKITTKRKVTKRKVTTKRKVARKRNPGVGVAASDIKIAQVRKTAPGGWKSTMGPYVIVTIRGNMIKGGSFRDLNAAKKALAGLRNKGRKGLKLVKVALAKKKKNPVTKRKVTSRRKTSAKKHNPRRRRRNAGRKGRYGKLIKRLGL